MQLAEKRARVERAFSPFAALRSLEVPALAPADPIVGYRTRAKLVADASGALGLYAAETHEVIDLPHCLVLEPLVAQVVAALRARLREYPLLAGVDVVRVADGVLVTLIAGPERTEAELTPILDVLEAPALQVLGVAVSRRAADAVQLLGTELKVLRGVESARRRLADGMPYYWVAHGGFVQNHDGTAASIQRRIVHALAPLRGRRVLELYAGAGSLSLWLAEQGAMVTAVESFKPACARLEATAKAAGLTLTVLAEDAASAMAGLQKRNQSFDAVIVNPPRRGVDSRVREGIAALGTGRVLYVSCEPSTLARDLSHLASLGLTVQALQPFDMIPLTDQVETLVSLERTGTPALRPVFEHAQMVAFDKPPHLAMEDLRLADEFRGAVPLTRLSKEQSGLVLFARNAQVRAELEGKLGLTLQATLLTRGITHGRSELGRGSERVRYQRKQVLSGHSLLHVTYGAAHTELERAFARLRHPVIGASKQGDRRTNQHFLMRHGLDRAFVHVSRLELTLDGERVVIEANLAPDLTLVIESLSAP